MTPDINKGLEHLPQTTPPDMVWENIERRLDDDKRRPALFWLKYTVGAAAAVIVLAIAAVLYNNINTQTQQRSTATNSLPNGAPSVQYTLPAQNDTTQQNNIVAGIDTQNTAELTISYADSVVLTTPTYQLNTVTLDYTAANFATGATSNTYTWNFGDGSMNTFRGNRNNNYTTQGTYTITLNNAYNGYLNSNQWNKKPDASSALLFGDKLARIQLADSINFTEPPSNESYAQLVENEYQNPVNAPLSTFSIDVDNASYSNTRRMINEGYMPPKDAIRIEEFVNYFDYKYDQPTGKHPFAIHLETASCPWNKDTKVVSIALKGKEMTDETLPASNLVFLIDVSGSMGEENKLPLVKQALKLLAGQLSATDRISIVTYAGSAGLALPSTPANKLLEIKSAIDNLESGGSTAGGEGIELAYKVAKENFMPNGNNRIILVTDGDFNVGLQSDDEMEKLIERKRKEGIFLTVCGFGMGNYKDSKMEILADKGNGNYYYIDNFNEGKKVFVTNLRSTLFTIAKDVKIQVEFNPKFVKAYRLIGYENRIMPSEDFDDDTKDAGELGAGHTVTALYEIIPAGSTAKIPGFTELKYQTTPKPENTNLFANEMLTVKLRYKLPNGETSMLLEKTLNNNGQSYQNASDNLRYACGVAVYGMLLRNSKFKGAATYTLAKQLLQGTQLNVDNGYRQELLELIAKTEKLLQ